MDIAGAKALKQRLGARAVEEDARPPRADVREDAPPVYRWTGVSKPESAPGDSDEVQTDRAVSRLLRLRPSFR